MEKDKNRVAITQIPPPLIDKNKFGKINKDVTDFVFDSFPEESDEITDRLPLLNEKNKEVVPGIIINYEIFLLKAKEGYEDYYKTGIFGIILKLESQENYYGVTIEDQSLGTVKFPKKIWEKIYSFKLNFSLKP